MNTVKSIQERIEKIRELQEKRYSTDFKEDAWEYQVEICDEVSTLCNELDTLLEDVTYADRTLRTLVVETVGPVSLRWAVDLVVQRFGK